MNIDKIQNFLAEIIFAIIPIKASVSVDEVLIIYSGVLVAIQLLPVLAILVVKRFKITRFICILIYLSVMTFTWLFVSQSYPVSKHIDVITLVVSAITTVVIYQLPKLRVSSDNTQQGRGNQAGNCK